MVLGALTIDNESSTVLAQEMKQWKTYLNSEYKFTMDYPSTDAGTIIGIIGNSSSDTLISEKGLIISIKPYYDLNNMKQYINNELNEDMIRNHTLIQNIHPVVYSNMSGYEYITMYGNTTLYTNILLNHDKELYHIFEMSSKDDYSRDTFHRIINSIEFLD